MNHYDLNEYDDDWDYDDAGYQASIDTEECCVNCGASALDTCGCCGADLCPRCAECGCGFCDNCLHDPNFSEHMAEIYAEIINQVPADAQPEAEAAPEVKNSHRDR